LQPTKSLPYLGRIPGVLYIPNSDGNKERKPPEEKA
jgi:hypothetical protein